MTRNCALDAPNIRTTTVDESLCRTCCFHGHLVTSVFETMHSSSANVLLSWYPVVTMSASLDVTVGYMHPIPWSAELRSLHTCQEPDVFHCCIRDAITVTFTTWTLRPVLSSTDHVFGCGPKGPAFAFVNLRWFVDRDRPPPVCAVFGTTSAFGGMLPLRPFFWSFKSDRSSSFCRSLAQTEVGMQTDTLHLPQ